MCGILGAYGNKLKSKISSKDIKNGLKSINHRGPDSSGYIFNDKYFLGHTRLSILDLSRDADQPMFSENKKWIIVFNGEIYNHNLLRKSLKKKSWNTSSDTETILEYISEKSLNEFLKVANGMFSFALLNKTSNSLYLVRDRLGIKPLYYTQNNNFLSFGSDINSFFKSNFIKPEIDYEKIPEYLSFRYVLEPNTFFKKIFCVPSGSYIKINNKNVKTKIYWSLENFSKNEKNTKSDDEIINYVEKLLINSIELRLLSDVPVGTFLSGGVDSSLITAIAKKLSPKNLKSYSIGFDDNNEFKFSKLVAKQINISNEEIVFNSERLISTWEKYIEYKARPIGVPNEQMLALMSKVLKKTSTVVLSGEGADELFSGYGRIFRIQDYCHSNNLDLKEEFFNKYEYVPKFLRDSVLSKKINNSNWRKDKKILKTLNSDQNSINKFFHKYHIKSLLERLDSSTMYSSVEGRVPFLDHNLIEYVYKNVPKNLKIKNINKINFKNDPSTYSEIDDTPKYILKKISEKYLPKDVIYRKKIGFYTPLEKYEKLLIKMSKDLLLNSSWCNYKILLKSLEKFNKSKKCQILWMFLNVQIFINKYEKI